jgi:hypothetical protein
MLPCMNSKVCGNTSVDPKQAKMFAEVFVCPACYALAESVDAKLRADVKRMELMVREAIRIALVEGKLNPAAAALDDLPKTELLKEIVRLSEKKDARPIRPSPVRLQARLHLPGVPRGPRREDGLECGERRLARRRPRADRPVGLRDRQVPELLPAPHARDARSPSRASREPARRLLEDPGELTAS